jgi:pyruvate kinase
MREYDSRLRRTKIVATLGPASAREQSVRDMIVAGVDVVRINSAHGTPESRAEMINTVRRVRAELGRHTAVLVDLQGPRIRMGNLDVPRQLDEGESVVFAHQEVASGDELPTTYAALARDVKPGSRILLDDGLLAVEVTDVEGDRVKVVVRCGGVLKSNKGINLPDDRVSAPAVTEKDRDDIRLALEHEADLIGISFVGSVDDLIEVRSLVGDAARLVAKIERPEALDDLERIVRASDAIMVARGDLGVELPFEEVPLRQKHLISQALLHGTPVITATQMLESMVNNPRPTRAEASDVANAILDGTDAVMLSAETAVGSYPLLAVRAMERIIGEVERAVLRSQTRRRRRSDQEPHKHEPSVADAIASAATFAAEMLEVPVILCFTMSGFTARKMAANRSHIPIVGLSTERESCRFLSLVWGVTPLEASEVPTYEAMLDAARGTLLEREYAKAGDRIVVTAGAPLEDRGKTNLIKVETV